MVNPSTPDGKRSLSSFSRASLWIIWVIKAQSRCGNEKDRESTWERKHTHMKMRSFPSEIKKGTLRSATQPQNTDEFVHFFFFEKSCHFLKRVEILFLLFRFPLPSSIEDDLNFELKYSQDPCLEYKTTAKTSGCKRGKIIGGKITVKTSLNNRRSQTLQK